MDQLQEIVLDHATLVVAFLGPWIGEIDVDPLQRPGGNLVGQDLDRVMLDQLEVREASLAGFQEAMPDTRLVHFDAEEVQVRVVERLLHQCVTVTETDFEHDLCRVTEDCDEIDRRGTEVNAVGWPEFQQGALLGRRQAASAPHEAADGTVAGLGFALHAGILFAVSGQCRPLSRQASGRDSIFAMA